ncbi:MAG: hypothetical protein JXQ23_03515 [Clostridia bacterium]|nr:hypothetical protein [Clostridia bacterium]
MYIFLILVVVVLYFIFRDRGQQIFSSHGGARAKLDERYAVGEIDDETYLKMKSNLNERR